MKKRVKNKTVRPPLKEGDICYGGPRKSFEVKVLQIVNDQEKPFLVQIKILSAPFEHERMEKTTHWMTYNDAMRTFE